MHSQMAFSMMPVVLATALAACGSAPGRGGQTVIVQDAPTGITVVGEGRFEAAPDLALLTIGVEARKPTVEEARTAAAQAQTAVLEALRGAGVAQEDIQTTALAVQPDFEYSEQGRRLLGYVVTNQVQVKVRALDTVGPLVDSAVSAGGDLTRLDSLTFVLSEPEAARAQAREEAIGHARTEAEQIASLLGVRLGAPVAVEDVGATDGGPSPVMMRMEARDSAAQTPIEPGRTEVRAQVRVRWEIAADE